MRRTQALNVMDRAGETVARGIMLGLLVGFGLLFLPIAAPLIAGWLIYAAMKARPRPVEPEYRIVE
jgi:hypothetical protein